MQNRTFGFEPDVQLEAKRPIARLAAPALVVGGVAEVGDAE